MAQKAHDGTHTKVEACLSVNNAGFLRQRRQQELVRKAFLCHAAASHAKDRRIQLMWLFNAEQLDQQAKNPSVKKACVEQEPIIKCWFIPVVDFFYSAGRFVYDMVWLFWHRNDL